MHPWHAQLSILSFTDMLEQLTRYQVILASQSPRRQELLKDLGIDFKVQTKKGIQETYPEHLTEKAIATYLSELKANAYPEFHKPGYLLITADTIVYHNNQVLNKPGTYKEAFQMLSALSGSRHQVITGVTITTAQQQQSFASTTSVHFNRLDKAEIDHYITHFQPYDKAGGYGIQEWIGYIGVKNIEGSYFNVMGLPVQELYQVLKHKILP